MPKPTKSDLTKYRERLQYQLASLQGDVGSMRDQALRASGQDNSVDHLADQGSDNHDQAFMLGLIENEEETIALIHEALERLDGEGKFPYGQCPRCAEMAVEEKTKGKKGKKIDPWIPKARMEYIPWACYCVNHQQEVEQSRESA